MSVTEVTGTKIKSVLSLFTAFLICVSLCGCDIFTVDTEELLSPPSLTGDMKPIADALKKSIDGDYTLKYPAAGNYRSAVIMNDIDDDGVFEAFAFYSVTDGETTTMHINAVRFKNKKWESVSDQKIVAGGVDTVDFCDLDGNGVLDILVGWEIYGSSEKQLAVYSFSGDSLAQRMLQRYTYFLCCDLDEDKENEILVINFSSADLKNYAGIYKLKSDGITEVTGCLLDGSVKTVREPLLGTLSSGKPAVYLDEIKGAGAITEVLFIEKGELVNPLMNSVTGENTATLRSSSMFSADINGDGIEEIPVQRLVPSVDTSENAEKLYLISWCSYNGDTLTSKLTTLMNLNDGYYLVIPAKLSESVSVLKNTEKRIRTLYKYDSTAAVTGEMLFSIRAFSEKEWKEENNGDSVFSEISVNDGTVFAAQITAAAAVEGITLEELKKSFQLISKGELQ